MPRKNGHVPAYRLHKPSGQARVIINHEHVYLGKFGTAESREKYARLIAESGAAGGSEGVPARYGSLSINELILAYWRFAKSHYIRNGHLTRALEGIREALRPLRALYGGTPASDFGPKKLKVLRHHMVEKGLSRGVINKRIGQIKRMFKWAVAEELIPHTRTMGSKPCLG